MATVAQKYETITTDLRTAILEGRLGPGEVLPSSSELCERYGTTRMTVRRALERLNAEGLIDVRQGAKARVRPTPPVRIAIVGADWRRHREAGRPGFDATVAEHGLIARQEILEVADPAVAPGYVTDAIGLAGGSPMVLRKVRMWADEMPVRLSCTWLPTQWASGTVLAQPRRVRGGVAGFIENPDGPAGKKLAFSDVDLESRNPSDEEKQLLNLARGVSVVHTVTTFLDESERPVYVQEEVADASRHRWRFRISL
jgi:GntR family transcriptional regulator